MRASIPAHRGTVTALAFAEDGEVLISGGTDGRVRMWDVADGRARGEFEVDSGVSSLAMSPSGTRLVVGCRRAGCSVWSYPEGARLSTMRNHRKPVFTVNVAPSGLIAVSGSYDGTVRLWEMDGCAELDSMMNDRRRTAGAVFTPDGEYLVTAGFGGAVGVWTVPGMELLRAVQCHETAVYPPVFSPDGRIMVTHGPDQRVRFWSTAEWQYAGELLLAHRGDLHVAFGRTLIAASRSTLWDIDATAPGISSEHELPCRKVSSLKAAEDDPMVAVGTREGRVLLLELTKN